MENIINDDHIFLSFGKGLPGQSSCHLYMAFQLLQNQASGHIKVKKGTGHVFYMATPSHTNESVLGAFSGGKIANSLYPRALSLFLIRFNYMWQSVYK